MRASIAFVVVLAMSGCAAWRNTHGDPQKLTDDQRRTANVWLAESAHDQSVKNAVIRQHTIFPYHFIENSARLNSLGTRDLNILAEHYLDNPGPLNVRRDDVPEPLYAERVNSVRFFLEQEGVATDQVLISDSAAGGDGMPAEQAAQILTEAREGETRTGASSGRQTRQPTGGDRVQQSTRELRGAASESTTGRRTGR